MKNNISSHFAFTTIAILFFCGCSLYTDISVTVDEKADISKYRTFAWISDDMDTANSPYNNEIIRNNIRNYFGHSFSERGYRIDLDTPDVLLQLVIVNKKKEKEVIYPPNPLIYYYCPYYYCSDFYSPYNFDYYYRYQGEYCSPYGYCKEKIGYIEGSITLNVIDRKQNKLVWSGTAKGDIYDPAYINQNIHPAVRSIMRKYPVKPMAEDFKMKNKNQVPEEKPITKKS